MTTPGEREQTRRLREWATASGYRLGNRIPWYVIQAYNNRKGATK